MKNKVLSLSCIFSGTMLSSVDTYSACVTENGYKIVHQHEAYGSVVGEELVCSFDQFNEKIAKVIDKYNITSWHGWSERAMVTDSYNFWFSLKYEGLESIEAYGYGTVPNEKAIDDLCEAFSFLLKDGAEKYEYIDKDGCLF